MASPTIVSPEAQSATFVELFFDLVFVFSLTQVVSYLAHHLTWTGLGQSVLVFWIVWWAWTQFTWALNAANTEHASVQIGTLTATGIAFLMAVSLPEAFAGKALWFALPYVLVRGLGLTLYQEVAKANSPEHHAAVLKFAIPSLAGLAAVLAGAVMGGPGQYVLWGLAIVLDVVAAAIGGREEHWDLQAEHFVERHGLFVIIALGETLIVAAAGLTEVQWTANHATLAVLAVATSCALWWSYFRGPMGALEHGLAATGPKLRASVARDAFSLVHFPMLCGVIAFAVAVELAVADPSLPLPRGGALALAISLPLFVGGTGIALKRADGRLQGARLMISALGGILLVGMSGVPPTVSLGVALGSVVLVIALERASWALESER